MKQLLVILLALSITINSFATECTIPVKLLEEGSQAPCRGYLFSVDKELQVRIMTRDYSLLKDEITSLNTIVDRLQKKDSISNDILQLEMQKTELWKTRAEDITGKYVAVEENRGRRDFLFVLMGIGLTVLAGWSLGQVSPGR